MPELRRDEVVGNLVIIAPERAARPDMFRATAEREPRAAHDDQCPFCPGNEDRTPPELARIGPGRPDMPGWRIRVVPNLYPVVSDQATASRTGQSATGAHEVIVLSPSHAATLGDLATDEVAELLGLWRDRVADHLAAGRAHAAPFVNHGRRSGASIEHPHAQLVALDIEPPALANETARFTAAGRDLIAEQMRAAVDLDLVVVDGDAPAWCPPAASRPYEAVLAHRGAGAAFGEATDDELAEVASSLSGYLGRLGALLGDVPYNVVVHTAGARAAPGYHWYVRISPRVATRAGFELGTGILVNAVAPKSAAADLRSVRLRRRGR